MKRLVALALSFSLFFSCLNLLSNQPYDVQNDTKEEIELIESTVK